MRLAAALELWRARAERRAPLYAPISRSRPLCVYRANPVMGGVAQEMQWVQGRFGIFGKPAAAANTTDGEADEEGEEVNTVVRDH